MSLETMALDHLPESYSVHFAYFQHVENASFLHQQLLDRNADFEYAFVDASVIISRQQLLSATFRAVSAHLNGALKTPNVHSEIVALLSPSSNIAESYRRYGISPATKDLLVVKVVFPTGEQPEPPASAQIWEHLKINVKGVAVAVTDVNISAATDLSKVRKFYKMNGLKWLDGIKDEQAKKREMEMLILSGMALRGV